MSSIKGDDLRAVLSEEFTTLSKTIGVILFDEEMSMLKRARSFSFTVQEYLALEEASGRRHE